MLLKVAAVAPRLAMVLLTTASLGRHMQTARGAPAVAGAYRKIEASFEIPNLITDPFDYEQTDVQVQLHRPDATTISLPAFFDGGTIWRVRYTPSLPGAYAVASITLNGQPSHATGLQPPRWTVGGAPGPGFIRIDRKHPRRFAFDNGHRYFPLGHNVAWGDTGVIFPKMHAVGENWSRVWMAHWAGNNLDWAPRGRNEPGQLHLEVARKWDGIVEAAEKNGIYFHMVLQHHGPYSSTTDSNWNENPWNAKNGGFLNTPEEFITNDRARALTKAKFRYVVARWGYSPAIMAWELFNEVEWTDAIKKKHEATVAAWHKEMAAFLRRQDPNHHLVTTSSDQKIAGLYDDMDYLQHHDYPNDVIGSARNTPSAILQVAKPDFGGEVGHGKNLPHSLRATLFASLMAGEAGAAQPWYWDVYERDNLYGVFAPAVKFVQASQLAAHDGAQRIAPAVVSAARVDLALAPGGGWAKAEQSEFVLDGNTDPAGIAKLPSFLQGQNHRDMNPVPLVFRVNNQQPGRMTVHLSQIARAGAHLKLSLDGQLATERDFPATATDTKADTALTVEVPAGPHAVTVENTGQDWVVVSDFTFTDAATALVAYGLTDGKWAALWLYHRAQVFQADATDAVTGRVTLPGLRPGRYRAVWWDTVAGRPLRTDTVRVTDGRPVSLDTPPVTRDLALYVEPVG